jgi:cystathionine beta-lyase/cystathionine gamma-synthase
VAYRIGGSGRPAHDHRLIRLSIGLETTKDLIGDLEGAFNSLRA